MKEGRWQLEMMEFFIPFVHAPRLAEGLSRHDASEQIEKGISQKSKLIIRAVCAGSIGGRRHIVCDQAE